MLRFLKSHARVLSTALVTLGLLAFTSGCEKLKARDALNKGVAAYKATKYEEAARKFKESIDADPTFDVARLYLATSYMSQWIPGADSPENKALAKQAEDEFMKVLERNPKEKLAIESIASMRYNQANSFPNLDDKLRVMDDAKVWYTKLVDVDPSNSKAYYSLGVIAWSKWYPKYKMAREAAKMKEDPGPIKDKKIREELKANYAALVEEGIGYLNKAVEIDKNYDDAMAYLNLLIRERADLADNGDDYKKDIATADNWVAKALEAKKFKAIELEKKSKGIKAE
ncbi:MAG: tetratricopeptide repeat protein [Acidobacteriota bacterium]